MTEFKWFKSVLVVLQHHMEIDIIERKENPMLYREELRVEILHQGEGTPPREAVRERLAAKLDRDMNVIVVRDLDTKFGTTCTVGDVRCYEDASYTFEIEKNHMLEKNNIGSENGSG